MILTKHVQHIGNIVSVNAMKFNNCWWSHFLTMQNARLKSNCSLRQIVEFGLLIERCSVRFLQMCKTPKLVQYNVCVCARARACVRACVRARARVYNCSSTTAAATTFCLRMWASRIKQGGKKKCKTWQERLCGETGRPSRRSRGKKKSERIVWHYTEASGYT